MLQAPSIEAIRLWLAERRPLDLTEPFSIQDIDPKPWSGHFNFLVESKDQRFVLRCKGPEWGESDSGIRDEYQILKEVERWPVGPRVFGIIEDFFGEPALFMEMLDGEPLGTRSAEEQNRFYPQVVKLIATISKISYREFSVPSPELYTSYKVHPLSWNERLRVIESVSHLRGWAEKLTLLLPSAKKMLEQFEPRLQQVLNASGAKFIFASAHIGHCFVTPNGLRFINWEKTGVGDPSFTLAVFLASVSRRPDFVMIKSEMVKTYVRENPIMEFAELVEQRLAEREISNLFWTLWAYALRNDPRPPEEATDAEQRYQHSLGVLERYR